jgi:hypothetical protein
VTITPRLNQILSFYVANFLPTYYDIALIPSPSAEATMQYRRIEAQDDYSGALGVLTQKSSVYGFFLAYGEIMTNLSMDPDLRMEMMSLKGLAVTALQSQIQKYGDNDPRTIDAVLLLLQSAVFTGDVSEATIHGNILRRLLYQKALREGPQSISIGNLFQALWLNVSLAATFMIPTMLDVDEWAPSIFKAFMEQNQLGPDPRRRYKEIKPFSDLDSAATGPLRPMFEGCRQFLWLYWMLPRHTRPGEDMGNLFTYLYAEFFQLTSRICNYLATLREMGHAGTINRNSERLHEDVFSWHTKHVLASGLLALMSAATGAVLHSGRALMMATNLLLIRLRDALLPVISTCLSPAMSKRALNTNSTDPRDELWRAVFWGLFIGTAVDHIPEAKRLHGTFASTWFTDNFVALIQFKELTDPEHVIKVLGHFIYTDHMLLDPAIWKDSFDPLAGGRVGALAMSRSASLNMPYPSPISEGGV